MKEIWERHKDRLFFGGLAMFFSGLFMVIGCTAFPIEKGGESWMGAANTILIGLAMLCYNKARGNPEKPDKEPDK